MRKKIMLIMTLCLVALSFVSAPGAEADVWCEKVTVTLEGQNGVSSYVRVYFSSPTTLVPKTSSHMVGVGQSYTFECPNKPAGPQQCYIYSLEFRYVGYYGGAYNNGYDDSSLMHARALGSKLTKCDIKVVLTSMYANAYTN